jgi:hypothetical protein
MAMVLLLLILTIAAALIISWIYIHFRGPKYGWGDRVLIVGGFYKGFKGEIQGYDSSPLGITYTVEIKFITPNDEQVDRYKDIYESHIKLQEEVLNESAQEAIHRK